MNSMQIIILVFSIFGILILVAFYFLKNQLAAIKKTIESDNDTVLVEWLKDMKTTVDKSSDVLERQLKDQRSTLTNQLQNQRETMDKQTKMIWERLENATNVISDMQKHIGGLQEFGKDMKDLSNVLKSPKLRGGLGEQFLYEILANSLPKDLYRTQYKFRDGSICDAVILTDKGIIPIDSKFPMENFKLMIDAPTADERDKAKKTFIKDVKKRVDEISSKYILPEEDTTDQAIMYIPSENVYYELIVNTQEIEDYCRIKNVVMASPNTISYFLKVVLVAYQKHELDKNAGEILKALAGIKVEAEKFNEELSVLDGHINRTTKSMDSVKSRYQKLFTRIENTQQINAAEEKPLLDSAI